MSDDLVQIEFGAKIDGAVADVKRFETELRSSFKQIQDSIGAVNGVFTKMQSVLASVTAVIAGGSMFKSAIDGAVSWTNETTKLSKSLGITTEEASVLAVGLHHIGVESDQYVQASTMMSRQLQNNANAFEVLGVKTRETNGHLRPATDLMREVNERLVSIQNPLERNQAGIAVYGRAWQEVRPILKLTTEVMKEAEERARELGLIVGPEGSANAKQYTEQLRDLNLVGKSLEVQFGSKVLPVFTRLGAEVSKTSVITQAITTVFETVSVVAANVAFVFAAVGRELGAIGAQLEALAHGDWATFHAISDAVKEDGVRARAELDALEKRLMGGTKPAASSAPPPADDSTPLNFHKTGKSGDMLAAQLALQKAGHEAERALQLEHLKEAQSIYDDAHRAGLLSDASYYDAKLAIETAAINASIVAKQKERDEAAKAQAEAEQLAKKARDQGDTEGQAKYEAQALKFKTDQVRALGDIAVLEAQRAASVRQTTDSYLQAEKKLTDDLAMIAANRAKSNADAEIAADRSALDQKRALRQIDAQSAFDQERELEARSFAATLAFLAAKRAQLKADDERGQAQQFADEEAAEREHQQRIAQIDRAAQLDRQRFALQAQQNVESAFATLLTDLTSRIKTVGDAFRAFGLSIAKVFQDLIAKKFADRLFGDGSAGGKLIDSMTKPVFTALDMILGKTVATEAAKTAATEEGVLARVAAETWGAAMTVLQTAWAAVKTIAIKAYEVMAGVYAALASIPYVGPVIAPIAAGAAFVTVAGYAAHIASAEGGWWDIPGDQIAQVHKNEMVLPAQHAQDLRDWLGSGGGGRGGRSAGGDTHLHVNIQALDGASVKRVLVDNPDALAAGIKKAIHDFHLRPER